MNRSGLFGGDVNMSSSFIRPKSTGGFASQRVIISPSPASFDVNDFVKYRFPFKYTILHVAALVFINVAVLVLQVALTLKSVSTVNYYAGFWGGGVNVIVGLISIFSVCLRNYFIVALLAAIHFISVVISIVALIIMSILALSFYDNCIPTYSNTLCNYSGGVAINWTIFALGIVSTLLSGFFFTIMVALIGGVFTKRFENR